MNPVAPVTKYAIVRLPYPLFGVTGSLVHRLRRCHRGAAAHARPTSVTCGKTAPTRQPGM